MSTFQWHSRDSVSFPLYLPPSPPPVTWLHQSPKGTMYPPPPLPPLTHTHLHQQPTKSSWPLIHHHHVTCEPTTSTTNVTTEPLLLLFIAVANLGFLSGIPCNISECNALGNPKYARPGDKDLAKSLWLNIDNHDPLDDDDEDDDDLQSSTTAFPYDLDEFPGKGEGREVVLISEVECEYPNFSLIVSG